MTTGQEDWILTKKGTRFKRTLPEIIKWSQDFLLIKFYLKVIVA